MFALVFSSIFTFLSLASFYFVEGTPQFTTCPSDPVCLSQPVTYVCNSGADSLAWIILDTNGDRFDTPVSYTQLGNVVGATGSIGGQFDTVLTVDGSSLVSNITFTPTLNINNYTVQCGAAGTLVNCSIVIADVPIAAHAISLGFGLLGSNRFAFSWSPQAVNPCLSHYILVITSAVDNINYTTTDTSLDLYATSTNNTLYTYTVLTVDTGGRSSESPIYHSYIPNVPLTVTNLMLTQTNYPTDTNETVNITVSWNHPPSQPRPFVFQFHINYNVSDVLQNITVPAGTTSRTLSGFTVGSVYTVGVAAVNVLGTGPIESATITILAPSTPEIPSTSTSVSSFISVISSTAGTTQSIPSVSVTESCNCDSTTQSIPSVSVTEGCNCGCNTRSIPSVSVTEGYNCASSTAVPIAVSVSVTFILTAILSSVLTLILTLLCVRSRSNKPVEQVKRDEGGRAVAAVAVYDEINTSKGQAASPVPLTSNPAYGPLNY